MNDLLPTKDLLIYRYKKIECDTNCKFCKSNPEILAYLICYPKLNNEWKSICKSSIPKIQKKLKNIHDIEIDLTFLYKTIVLDKQSDTNLLYFIIKGIVLIYITEFL